VGMRQVSQPPLRHSLPPQSRCITERLRFVWPGKVFYPDDDGYKALIASPNGRSMALILITHKSVFGERRMIESINVFCQHPDFPNYNMYFKIKDHNEEDDDTDWEGQEEESEPGQPDFSVSPWPSSTPAPSR
jgi:hypothetical protein